MQVCNYHISININIVLLVLLVTDKQTPVLLFKECLCVLTLRQVSLQEFTKGYEVNYLMVAQEGRL